MWCDVILVADVWNCGDGCICGYDDRIVVIGFIFVSLGCHWFGVRCYTLRVGWSEYVGK